MPHTYPQQPLLHKVHLMPFHRSSISAPPFTAATLVSISSCLCLLLHAPWLHAVAVPVFVSASLQLHCQCAKLYLANSFQIWNWAKFGSRDFWSFTVKLMVATDWFSWCTLCKMLKVFPLYTAYKIKNPIFRHITFCLLYVFLEEWKL